MTHARRIGSLFLALAAFVLLVATPARSALAGAMLTAVDREGREVGAFPLTRTEVHGEIDGNIISVDVTQRFQNPYGERIEAVYTFPLPDQAAVDDMEMHIGDRIVRAEVQRRVDARAAYVAAMAHGQRAGLLEQERPNVFTMSVANIDPGGEIVVRLHYFDVAHDDHGTYEMAFPMTVGPRFVPGAPLPGAQSGNGTRADTDRVPDASRISPAFAPPGTISGHTVGLSIALNAPATIASLETPQHTVDVHPFSPDRTVVTLRALNEIPNRDFVLRWTLAAPELKAAVYTHRPDDRTDGYLALFLEPRHTPPVDEIAPREIFFLLDTSGSMQGPPIATALAAVRRAIETLNPSDTFQIIDFADTASSFAPRPLPNTPENVQRAMEYLAQLRASGGTNQLSGIHAALTAPGDAMRLRYVVFLTDGYIGNEREVLALTQHEIGQARIFGFGIGASVNRYLLDEVSHAGRGAAEYILANDTPQAAVERFYQRIARPYLTDIQVDWGTLAVDRVLPSPMPDLSAFEPLVILGRYGAPGSGVVTVRGRIAGHPFERRVHVELPGRRPEGSAISRVWARAQITDLMRAMHFAGEQPTLVDAITNTALEHHLVSPYTSLIAIDQNASPGADGIPRRVDQPAEAPAGVNLAAAGGASAQSPARNAANQYAQIVPPIYGARTLDGDQRGPVVPNPTPTVAQPTSVGSTEVSLAMAPSSPRHACASCNVGASTRSDRNLALVIAGIALALVIARRARRR
jgi:Ca-activated chloride channel family protein